MIAIANKEPNLAHANHQRGLISLLCKAIVSGATVILHVIYYDHQRTKTRKKLSSGDFYINWAIFIIIKEKGGWTMIMTNSGFDSSIIAWVLVGFLNLT